MLSTNGTVDFVVSFGRPPVELGTSPYIFYRYLPYGTTIVRPPSLFAGMVVRREPLNRFQKACDSYALSNVELCL